MPLKKKRGVEEQSKESEVEKVREESIGSLNSSIKPWCGPDQVLELIFTLCTKYNTRNVGNDLVQQKKFLLGCRLVHPQWRIWMDDVLEKGCLKTWENSNFSMDVLRSDHLFNFAHLPVLTPPPENNSMMKLVMVPTAVQESGVTPFPCNSLRVSSYHSEPSVYANLNESYNLMGLVSFFADYGHHLTSLILFSVNLAPETLQGILRGTQNLQAMTLDTVRIAINFREKPWQQRKYFGGWALTSLLPALPKLKHIRLFNTDTVEEVRELALLDPTLFEWIMTPYNRQLLTFDGDDNDTRSLSEAIPVGFPLLKKLSIWKVKFSSGRLFDFCRRLEYIFLGELQLGLKTDLEYVQLRLSLFAGTLIQLQLDVVRNSKTGNVLKYYDWEWESEFPRRWSAKKVVFSKLTTFSILFPKFAKEVGTLNDMLSCMPNLETLNLFRFREDWEERQEASPEEIASAREHVEQEEYWVICPRLKKIIVRLEVCDSSIFFTKRVSP